jgi:hypothetical protein
MRKAKLSSYRLGCQANSSSGILTFRLSMLCAVFLYFCCYVSPEIRSFHLQSDVRFMCLDYFRLLITAKVSGERSLILSSLASNTFDKGVGVCVKGNFVDEQGNRTELVEILCDVSEGISHDV